eukprot:350919-Chlamydomonas_euryale.AAC.2
MPRWKPPRWIRALAPQARKLQAATLGPPVCGLTAVSRAAAAAGRRLQASMAERPGAECTADV